MKRVHLPGSKHLHQVSKYKKLNGSALILAVLAAPFAVQAMSGTFAVDTGDKEISSPSQYTEQPPKRDEKAEVKADINTGAQSMQNDVRVESKSESSNSGSSDVDVTVNGKKVPVPKNGSIHKRMSSSNGETVVDVKVKNGSGSLSANSSTSVVIDQQSYSSSEKSNEGGTGQ